MDVREFELWHKGAKILLLEKKKEELYHMRLSQHGEAESYEKEIGRLDEILQSCFVNQVRPGPKTESEQRDALKAMALSLGLKIKKKE